MQVERESFNVNVTNVSSIDHGYPHELALLRALILSKLKLFYARMMMCPQTFNDLTVTLLNINYLSCN
jgi:hypothetical protein